MKKNIKMTSRRYSTMSHASWTAALFAVVLSVAMMWIAVDSKCKQLSGSIGRERQRLQQKVKELRREQGRWSDMNTRASLDAALVKHGLAMQPPRANQTVRMGVDGNPVPGAGAIAIARLRQAAEAKVAGAEPRRGSPARAVRRR